MKKMLFLLITAVLFTGMLFAVDITSEISGGSWSNTGNEFTVTFDVDDESVQYIKVGFTGTELADGNTITAEVEDKKTVELAANASDSGRFDNSTSGSEVYLYYQVRTDKNVTLSLQTVDMTHESDPVIPFFIGCTTEGLGSDSSVIVGNDQLTEVLKFSPTAPSTVELKQGSIDLDIYTTADNIPAGANGEYTGKIKLSVATSD